MQVLGLILILIGLTTATASAGVLSSTGVTVILPPASVARNMTESDDTIFLCYEQQSVVLENDLLVDITTPGTYGEPDGGTIPAGTCVNSYFIHYDLIAGFTFRNGSITFTDKWATLTGLLLDGTPIYGEGDICITQ